MKRIGPRLVGLLPPLIPQDRVPFVREQIGIGGALEQAIDNTFTERLKYDMQKDTPAAAAAHINRIEPLIE